MSSPLSKFRSEKFGSAHRQSKPKNAKKYLNRNVEENAVSSAMRNFGGRGLNDHESQILATEYLSAPIPKKNASL